MTSKKYLNETEYAHLRNLVRRMRLSDTRNCLLLEVAMATGARASEILNITAEDLNPTDRSVFIRGLKGSNDRELPLKRGLFRAIKNHCPNSGKIFPISYARLWQIWENYRPAEKSFKSLRHTFAMRVYAKTKDIRLVKAALGHRKIENTLVYADYSYSVGEFRKGLF